MYVCNTNIKYRLFYLFELPILERFVGLNLFSSEM